MVFVFKKVMIFHTVFFNLLFSEMMLRFRVRGEKVNSLVFNRKVMPRFSVGVYKLILVASCLRFCKKSDYDIAILTS